MRDEIESALSRYLEAEIMFRLSLDAKSDRLFLIGKSAAVRNIALDRYNEAIERLLVNNPNSA